MTEYALVEPGLDASAARNMWMRLALGLYLSIFTDSDRATGMDNTVAQGPLRLTDCGESTGNDININFPPSLQHLISRQRRALFCLRVHASLRFAPATNHAAIRTTRD